VFGTKYRRRWIKDYVKVEIIKNFYKTQKRHPAWYFHNINTDEDHLHMMMEIPPSYSVAAVVKELKSCSSGYLRKRFKFIDKIYPDSGIWSVGYFVSTVGINEKVIRKYIENQDRAERSVDVTAEYS
jgi:putative transposase